MAKKPYLTERYADEKKFEKDAARKKREGYEVLDVKTEDKGRGGCLSWGLLGVFNFLRKKKVEYVVTYKLLEDERS